MRRLLLALAAVAVGGATAAPSRAHADPIDDLVTKGEAHAKRSEFTQAIRAFKEADRQRPRARHACLIALAYTRLEALSQAELFLEVCRQRASAQDPLPDWIDTAERQLEQKIARLGFASVALKILPEEAAPIVSVSSFAPDETFAPRPLHLSPARYVLEIKAPGFEPQRVDLDVTSGAPRLIEITLERPAARTPRPVEPVGARAPSRGSARAVGPGSVRVVGRPSHRTSRRVLLAAGGLAAAGVLAHLVMGYEHGQLETTSRATYDAHSGAYDAARIATVGCYGLAAVTAAVGLYLRGGEGREAARAVRVGAAPLAGGGLLTLEWAR